MKVLKFEIENYKALERPMWDGGALKMEVWDRFNPCFRWMWS